MTKRLVLCCDGTWHTHCQRRRGLPCPTNVPKIARGVAPQDARGVEQRVRYREGLGVRLAERLPGGAFDVGLSREVKAVYRWVVEEYDPGDELFFFGFSRGAYTVRAVAGLVHFLGLLRPELENLASLAWAVYADEAHVYTVTRRFGGGRRHKPRGATQHNAG